MNTFTDHRAPDERDALATTLLANLGAFQGFARKRLGNDDLAADAVQESLLRALKAAPRLHHDHNLLAWFYRILRNVIVDLHRRHHRERTLSEAVLAESMEPDPELESAACHCLRGLLSTLSPSYAEVLEQHDLKGTASRELADQLGISTNLLKVRLHRARKQLRNRLEQTCQACASHGCLDCTCESKEVA